MLQLQYNVPLQAALMILLTAQRQAAAGEMSLLAQPEVVQVLQSLVCSDNTASAAASPAAGKFCRSQYLEKVPSRAFSLRHYYEQAFNNWDASPQNFHCRAATCELLHKFIDPFNCRRHHQPLL